VDCGLCYGWIDGIKKRVDDVSYMHRFTPRRAGSIWSNVNTKRAAALIAEGLMRPPGQKAFDARIAHGTGIYTNENGLPILSKEYEARCKAKKKAWEFLMAQPPGYKKLAIGWIMQAKKEETRLKRLRIIMDASAKGTRTRWM